MQTVDIIFGFWIFYVSFLCSQNVVCGYSIENIRDEIELARKLLHKPEPVYSINTKRENENGFEDKFSMLSSGGVPDSILCEKLSIPKHGTIRCGGTLCLVQCDVGYIQSDDHAFVYACNSKTKQWSPLPKDKPVPWPDCEKEPFYYERRRDEDQH